MSPRRRPAAPLWALVWLAALALLGCAGPADGPLWVDPGVLRFDPERPRIEVAIHNVSDMPRPVAEFGFAGDDWGSLRFVDETLPRAIPAHAAITLAVEVSPASFRTEPGRYRSGRASLTFRSDRHELAVPVEFVGTAERRPAAPPIGLSLAALLGLGLAATLVPLGRSTPARPSLVTRLVSPSAADRADRLAFGSALAAGLLLAATIPVGAGVCDAALTGAARVGPTELAGCRAGLGGYPMTLLPADPGLWWWLIASTLLVAAGAVTRARRGASWVPIAAAAIRPLGLAVALTALMVGLGPATTAPVDLILAQARSVDIAGVTVPGWGVVAQPLAFVGMFALVVALPGSDADPDPLPQALARLERWLWSALIVAVFLGGGSVPGLSGRPVPLVSHAGMFAAELLAFFAKAAVVDLGLRRAGDVLAARGVSPATWLRTQQRWAVPALLVDLVLVVVWRSW